MPLQDGGAGVPITQDVRLHGGPPPTSAAAAAAMMHQHQHQHQHQQLAPPVVVARPLPDPAEAHHLKVGGAMYHNLS